MSKLIVYNNEVELTNDGRFLNLDTNCSPCVTVGSEQGEYMIISDLDSMISFFEEGLEMLLNKREFVG